MSAKNLDRRIWIYLYGNGIMVYAVSIPERRYHFAKGALPIGSVDTPEEAQKLLVMFCKTTYDEQHLLPMPVDGQGEFSGDNAKLVEHIEDLFKDTYQLMKLGIKGQERAKPFFRYLRAIGQPNPLEGV